MDRYLHTFGDFLTAQNHTWKLSAANYHGLDHVVEKEFLIDSFQIRVQFNPERMKSSTAKIDNQSIAARKCFLCKENRPPEQISLELGHSFILLVNPFPIFRNHFTIPSLKHTDQRLISNLEALFDIARQMEGYTVFYNGPECGASAPDHLHFQAGERGFLPVELEFESLKLNEDSLYYVKEGLRIWYFGSYLRKMISFESDSIQLAILAVENVYQRLLELQPEKVEPMINLLCYFKEGKWIVHFFPRKLHRPTQFFADGERQLLISPASVDFGGVFITPRREDFEKISAYDIKDIFEQVTLDELTFNELKNAILSFNP